VSDVIVVSQKPSDAGELIGLARTMGNPVIVAFQDSAEKVEELLGYGHRVYRVKSSRPEVLAKAVNILYEEFKPKLILGPNTKNVKDAMSVVAGLHDIHMAPDVVEVRGEVDGVIYKRGFMSERVTITVKVPYPTIILANPRIAEPAPKGGVGELKELSFDFIGVKVVEVKPKELSGINLEAAEVVVGVGRGFKAKDDLRMAFELAKLLGGQVGGTRPIAADLKWLPEDAWIGISGKRIAPKLYIAIGVSGAPQHMSGVAGSKIIVAVNKDKAAPIIKQSDYGVVADLYKFIPTLIEVLKRKRGASHST
jgi:electron transfer flavoprotein alpha subunit